ncbi:MAG TPA: NUDIX domain-containing protein [Polyangiaceae bacterium]|nr:NUDIX domain-containing protein [Polyangiaceae bacterium]
MRVPLALYDFVKEAARHILRRPVVGVTAIARAADGRYVLIRRSDTGQWALPGGTVEWGETLERCIRRELLEEAGVEVISLAELLGVYSRPERDFRFHAVTVVVRAKVTLPLRPPKNPVEIAEVGLFHEAELPQTLSHQMTDMLVNGISGKVTWE